MKFVWTLDYCKTLILTVRLLKRTRKVAGVDRSLIIAGHEGYR